MQNKLFGFISMLDMIFRMSRTTFYFLLNILRPYLQTEESGPVIFPEKQLYIALYVLGTPDSYR